MSQQLQSVESAIIEDMRDFLGASNESEGAITLSQSATPEQLQNVKELLNKVLALVEKTEILANLQKNVKFHRSLPRHSTLCLHLAFPNGENGWRLETISEDNKLDVDKLSECAFLVVSSAHQPYQEEFMHTVDEVQITVKSINGLPSSLIFDSGASYGIWDGYSLTHCVKMGYTNDLVLE